MIDGNLILVLSLMALTALFVGLVREQVNRKPRKRRRIKWLG